MARRGKTNRARAIRRRVALLSAQCDRRPICARDRRQKGVDVVVSVFGPDGKLITAVDNPNGSQGAETVHITAEATGIYRLEVSSFEKAAPLGSYQAKLAELRPATQADKERLTARRAFEDDTRGFDLISPRHSIEVAVS